MWSGPITSAVNPTPALTAIGSFSKRMIGSAGAAVVKPIA
jgi:hypothetical protein